MYTHTHTHSNIVQPSTALGFLTELILCILVFSHVHPPDLGVAYKKKKKNATQMSLRSSCSSM